MKDLLGNDFINYYNQHPEQPVNDCKIELTIYESDFFELIDKTGKKDGAGNDIYGSARYSNPDKIKINVINYEKFINSLPPRVKNNIKKSKCDFIVYSANSQYFLLNELTNTAPGFINEYKNSKGERKEGKLATAQRQLKHSLENITNVSSIDGYIRSFTIKQCCLFNSYSVPISDINAEQAFNQLDNIDSEPSKLSVSEIENFGFEFWVFSGSQTCLLEDKSSNLKSVAEQSTDLSATEQRSTKI